MLVERFATIPSDSAWIERQVDLVGGKQGAGLSPLALHRGKEMKIGRGGYCSVPVISMRRSM